MKIGMLAASQAFRQRVVATTYLATSKPRSLKVIESVALWVMLMRADGNWDPLSAQSALLMEQISRAVAALEHPDCSFSIRLATLGRLTLTQAQAEAEQRMSVMRAMLQKYRPGLKTRAASHPIGGRREERMMVRRMG